MENLHYNYLEEISNSVNDILYIYDFIEKSFLYLSDNATRIFSPQQIDKLIHSRTLWENFTLPEDKESIQHLYGNGNHFNSYYHLRQTNHINLPIRDRGTVHRDSENNPAYLCGILSCINDCGDCNNSISENNSRFKAIYESMTDCFVSVNLEGKILEFNRHYQEMLGYTPEELKNLTYFDLTPEKWHPMEFEIVQNEIIPLGASRIYEKEYIHKNGSVFPVELRTFLLKSNDNSPPAMWAIVRNISERKKYEKQILVLNNRLKSSNEELHDLLAVICHDMRSPLLNILGFSEQLKNQIAETIELIKPKLENETLKEFERIWNYNPEKSFYFIHSSVQRIDHLLSGFSRLNRIGKTIPLWKEVNLDSLLHDIKSQFQFLIDNNPIKIKYSQLGSITTDRNSLLEIISNIIDNSIKYRKENHSLLIEIQTSYHPNETIISIKDNGKGMPSYVLNKIFEPFYRGENNKSIQGHGLGLSIVRKLAHNIRGDIQISSELHQGTEITLTLPTFNNN